jgi:hypothetical protein
MRDYKFRGKTFGGKWIVGDLFRTPGNTGDGIAIQYWDEDDGWMNEDVQVESVGLWTNAYDNYDVPVFESDIIETKIDNTERVGRLSIVKDIPSTLRGVVKYNKYQCKFGIYFERNDLGLGHHLLFCEFGYGGNDLYVIGKYFDEPFPLEIDRDRDHA